MRKNNRENRKIADKNARREPDFLFRSRSGFAPFFYFFALLKRDIQQILSGEFVVGKNAEHFVVNVYTKREHDNSTPFLLGMP